MHSLVVEPARALCRPSAMIAFSPKGNDLVSQNALGRIEHFSLPCEMIYETRDVLRVSRPGATMAVPLASPFGISPAGL